MTNRPTRASAAGRAYLELRKAASSTGRPTDELLQLYALEGLLDRLSGSPHASRFVLKGGALLAVFDVRRPTRDVDLAAIDVNNDLDERRGLVNEIIAVPVDDGLAFDAMATTAQTIRNDDANTRWRDFVDIASLARRDLDEGVLVESIRRVAVHRQTPIRPLGEILAATRKWPSNTGERGVASNDSPTRHPPSSAICSTPS